MRTATLLAALALCLSALIVSGVQRRAVAAEGAAEQSRVPQRFVAKPDAAIKADPAVFPHGLELSGMAPALADEEQRRGGHYWGLNDSGDQPRIWRWRGDQLLQTVNIKGASNLDWEAMTRDATRLYVADCGDNGFVRAEYQVYVVPEPTAGATEAACEAFSYVYEDGKARNCEAMFFAWDKLHLITKTRHFSIAPELFVIDAWRAGEQSKARRLGEMPMRGLVTDACMWNDQVLHVLTYHGLLRWEAKSTEDLLKPAQGHWFFSLGQQEAIWATSDQCVVTIEPGSVWSTMTGGAKELASHHMRIRQWQRARADIPRVGAITIDGSVTDWPSPKVVGTETGPVEPLDVLTPSPVEPDETLPAPTPFRLAASAKGLFVTFEIPSAAPPALTAENRRASSAYLMLHAGEIAREFPDDSCRMFLIRLRTDKDGKTTAVVQRDMGLGLSKAPDPALVDVGSAAHVVAGGKTRVEAFIPASDLGVADPSICAWRLNAGLVHYASKDALQLWHWAHPLQDFTWDKPFTWGLVRINHE